MRVTVTNDERINMTVRKSRRGRTVFASKPAIERVLRKVLAENPQVAGMGLVRISFRHNDDDESKASAVWTFDSESRYGMHNNVTRVF